MGEGELELFLPSPIFGRGAGGEGKDLSKMGMLPVVSTIENRPPSPTALSRKQLLYRLTLLQALLDNAP
jgi:hypothetical protein